MSSPIRLATAALSRRIYAGRPTKDGMALKEPRYDVTSDVLKAVVEHIGADREATVNIDGEPAYTITVRSIAAPLGDGTGGDFAQQNEPKIAAARAKEAGE